MNMINLASGTLELEDNRWCHLRRVLEMILPHWIDSTILGGEGIQLFLLQDSKQAVFGKEDYPPVIVLRALREAMSETKPIPGYTLWAEMLSGIHVDPLMEKLQRIFDNATDMKAFWEDEERYVDPNAGLGQGDGTFRSYKIVFSSSYYDTFLRIHLSHHYTPA